MVFVLNITCRSIIFQCNVTGWASEANNILLLREGDKKCLCVVTDTETKGLDKFLSNFGYKLFGAKPRSCTLIGKIALTVQHGGHYNYVKNGIFKRLIIFEKQLHQTKNSRNLNDFNIIFVPIKSKWQSIMDEVYKTIGLVLRAVLK